MNKAPWIILALALVALSGCQKSEPTGPSSGEGLTQTNAQFMVGLVTEGDLVGIPKAPGTFLGGPGGTGKSPLAGLCTFTWSGNGQDLDGDDVPLDAYVEVDCDTTGLMGQDTIHEIVRGRLRGVDADDNDPWVGRAELSGLGGTGLFYRFFEVRSAAGTTTLEHQFGGYLESTHQGNTFGENVDLTQSVHTVTPQGDSTVQVQYTGSLTFTPVDTTWNPGTGAQVDGTLTLNASWVVEQVGTLTVETLDPLQVRVNCNNGDPVSGTLRLSDGTNTLEITWTACNQWTATYNGGPL